MLGKDAWTWEILKMSALGCNTDALRHSLTSSPAVVPLSQTLGNLPFWVWEALAERCQLENTIWLCYQRLYVMPWLAMPQESLTAVLITTVLCRSWSSSIPISKIRAFEHIDSMVRAERSPHNFPCDSCDWLLTANIPLNIQIFGHARLPLVPMTFGCSSEWFGLTRDIMGSRWCHFFAQSIQLLVLESSMPNSSVWSTTLSNHVFAYPFPPHHRSTPVGGSSMEFLLNLIQIVTRLCCKYRIDEINVNSVKNLASRWGKRVDHLIIITECWEHVLYCTFWAPKELDYILNLYLHMSHGW